MNRKERHQFRPECADSKLESRELLNGHFARPGVAHVAQLGMRTPRAITGTLNGSSSYTGDLTGQDDTEANDDQDYEGTMESESESESEQSTAENWSPQQRQRPNTFSHLLPPLSSISDESSFSSVRLTRSKTNVQAHPSNQFHLT